MVTKRYAPPPKHNVPQRFLKPWREDSEMHHEVMEIVKDAAAEVDASADGYASGVL